MKALTNILIDGKLVKEGENIKGISKEQLEELREAGAVAEGPAEKEETETPEAPEGGEAPTGPVSEEMTKAELVSYAKDHGIEVDPTVTKAELVKTINEAEAAK